MSARKHLNHTSSLVGGVLAAFILVAPAAVSAQEASATGDEATEIDEVVVTGTRIRIQDYVASNPVVSVTSEQIAYSGVTNVTDFMTDFPALVGSFNSQDSADTGGQTSAGLNLLDLRNLGTNRTLVLVNGRRHVAGSPGSAAIDTNTIPVALIDRVEILTGGASAVYGADGVSGVVNFVLKDDFEGVDMRAQLGRTYDGGGDSFFLSGVVGHNFLDGRMNVVLAVEHADDQAITQFDRRYSRPGDRFSLARNPDDPGTFNSAADDPNILDYVPLRDLRYIDTARGGAVHTNWATATSIGGVSFNGDGTPWNDGIYNGGFTMIGGDGTRTDEFIDDLLPELQRTAVNANLNFEISPAAQFFFEGKYVEAHTEFLAQPTFNYGILIPTDNPFMPASIRADAMAPGGFGSFVLMGRDNFDLGYTGRDIERRTYRVATGLKGDLTPHLNYEVSYVFGRTEVNSLYLNNRINERWYAAIDAVDEGQFLTGVPNGNIVCRSNLDPTAVPDGDVWFQTQDVASFGTTFKPGPNSGCVPANVFGDGSISAAARAWINTDTLTESRIEQEVFTAYLAGVSTPLFELPAGPVGYAVGIEHRRESSVTEASEIEQLGFDAGYDISWAGQSQDVRGEFDVSEAFVEVNVPLLADLPGVQSLTLDAAYRYSDYSTSGGSEAYKVGLRYRPNDWVMFRGTLAQAVRAPNIGELFLPSTQTFAILQDPCDASRQGQGGSNRAANCAAHLTALGIADPGSWQDTTSVSQEGVISGNPDLIPETADTITYGLVFTPQRYLTGFSFAIDYYDIDLTDAINAPSAQFILNQCYDQPQPNQFCDLIRRNGNMASPTFGAVNFFEQAIINVSNYTTKGYDFSIRYGLEAADFGAPELGRLSFAFVGSKLEGLTFIDDPTSPEDFVGRPGSPEWIASVDVTWEVGNLLVNYGYTHYSETIRIDPDVIAADPDFADSRFFNYSALTRHDVQARYNINDSVTVYGGINNLFNQQPDMGSTSQPIGAQGRYMYLGATMRLGGLASLLGR
jgi:iron complex outermembrane receptor protein